MPYSFLKLRGWAIHAITASGALFTLFGFYAVAQQRIKLALVLMLVTIIIDAIDGPLARFWKVKHVVPHFDGARLDYIVDFSSWVLLPAFFLVCNDLLLPKPWSIMAACSITLSSCYQFCCTDLKSTASNFKRFPSAWSLLIILLAVWHLSPVINLLLISLGVVLSFVPTYYSHPFQKNELGNPRATFIINKLLVVSGVAVLVIALIQTIFYPTEFKIMSVIQQIVFVLYFIFCAYGTYQNWD